MDLVLHIGANRTGAAMVAQSLAATIKARPNLVTASSEKTPQSAIFANNETKHRTQLYDHHVGWMTTEDNTRWIEEGAA